MNTVASERKFWLPRTTKYGAVNINSVLEGKGRSVGAGAHAP